MYQFLHIAVVFQNGRDEFFLFNVGRNTFYDDAMHNFDILNDQTKLREWFSERLYCILFVQMCSKFHDLTSFGG